MSKIFTSFPLFIMITHLERVHDVGSVQETGALIARTASSV